MPLVTKNFADIITFSRASTATYFDSAGVLTSAAIDAPRFDYDPSTLAAQGLLIEEARTNLYTYSQQIQNTIGLWTVVRGSTIANAINGLDGTLSASKLQEDTTVSSSHYIYQTGTSYTSGTTYTQSVYVKAAGRTQIQMSFPSTAFTTEQRVLYDLTAVTATTQSGTPTSSITSVGNGWYRCVITAAATATIAANTILVYLYNGSISYTGDGTSGVYLWGAQLEAGAFPTSYIPTTVAQVTRNADQASVNTLSPWYNASASTLYTEFTSPVPTTVTASAVVAGYDDGTANNRFANFYTSATPAALAANQTTAGTPNYTITGASGLTLSSVQKQATRFQAGSYASSVNGAAAVTDSFASAPPTVNTLRFGLRPSGTQANMWLRRVTVYPRGLSNAELQAITA